MSSHSFPSLLPSPHSFPLTPTHSYHYFPSLPTHLLTHSFPSLPTHLLTHSFPLLPLTLLPTMLSLRLWQHVSVRLLQLLFTQNIIYIQKKVQHLRLIIVHYRRGFMYKRKKEKKKKKRKKEKKERYRLTKMEICTPPSCRKQR
jgi:hypothetical protein